MYRNKSDKLFQSGVKKEHPRDRDYSQRIIIFSNCNIFSSLPEPHALPEKKEAVY